MKTNMLSENFNAPITKYGMPLVVGVTILIIVLLFILKLDNVPVAKLIFSYYFR